MVEGNLGQAESLLQERHVACSWVTMSASRPIDRVHFHVVHADLILVQHPELVSMVYLGRGRRENENVGPLV